MIEMLEKKREKNLDKKNMKGQLCGEEQLCCISQEGNERHRLLVRKMGQYSSGPSKCCTFETPPCNDGSHSVKHGPWSSNEVGCLGEPVRCS